MDARSVWFRETGEGRPKEQLLIETMFCVYYLSKGSAVRVTCALHLEPPFLNTFISPAPTPKHAVILADQRISAAEAYEWGLVEEVAEPGKAFDAAMMLAGKVAAQPPLSVAMTKLTVNRLAHALDDLAGHMDLDQFALASLSEDHKEGVAAFLERRKPKFRGR